MSESIDIYIDTTSHESSEATEFDYELFERFMSGGPWVAHSEYMKLKDDNAKLRELVSVLAHCAADSGCDSCPINGGCARVGELDLCETAHDRMRELGVEV